MENSAARQTIRAVAVGWCCLRRDGGRFKASFQTTHVAAHSFAGASTEPWRTPPHNLPFGNVVRRIKSP